MKTDYTKVRELLNSGDYTEIIKIFTSEYYDNKINIKKIVSELLAISKRFIKKTNKELFQLMKENPDSFFDIIISSEENDKKLLKRKDD